MNEIKMNAYFRLPSGELGQFVDLVEPTLDGLEGFRRCVMGQLLDTDWKHIDDIPTVLVAIDGGKK